MWMFSKGEFVEYDAVTKILKVRQRVVKVAKARRRPDSLFMQVSYPSNSPNLTVHNLGDSHVANHLHFQDNMPAEPVARNPLGG